MSEETNRTQVQKAVSDPRKRRRRIALLGLAAGFIVAAAAYSSYWAAVGRYRQSTDDAYVAGNRVAVMAQEPGTVVAVLADNTMQVRRGETLVQLDDANARIALQQAKAQLASTVRRINALYTTEKQQQADVGKQRATLQLAESDYSRNKNMHALGYYSSKNLKHSATLVNVNERSLTAAQQTLEGTRAQLGDTGIPNNPEVRLAAAHVRAAWLALQRTQVVAPVSGRIAERGVQVGEQVQPGLALMAIVPLDRVWVEANFKESQLGNIHVGQPVVMHADVYGGSVSFHGRVIGIGAGSGSAFSLLPPQNATGNWIKVVQRVPVRIGISKSDLAHHPLRIGLSMKVTIETAANAHDPANAIVDPGTYKTAVYALQADGADQLIAQIIHANCFGTEAHAIAASGVEPKSAGDRHGQ